MTDIKKQRKFKDHGHADVLVARERVVSIIDAIDPDDLVLAIKRAPSLRGMILGYIAEEMFEKHVLNEEVLFTGIIKHDDHDRTNNKSDRSFCYKKRVYTVQLKSIQTNSIAWHLNENILIADVQNDASDRRKITLPNGNQVETTNYQIGDFDILAVPLFPFTGEWDFAYKRNRDCRKCESNKYSEEDRKYLLSTTEKITWPLAPDWTTQLETLLDNSIGEELDEDDVLVTDIPTPLADAMKEN